MEIEVKPSIWIDGKQITYRQLEVFAAVAECGSKTAAAKKLNLSVPVVHNYMVSFEKVAGCKLMASTPRGTELTEMGLRVLEVFQIMEKRCSDKRTFTVSCTPVTEDLVTQAVSATKTDASIIVSDDETNIRSLKEGYSDLIVLDDPILLSEVEDYEWTEVGYMDMIHVDRGESYIRYSYGAQRIAYEQMVADGKKFSIDDETCHLDDLLNSDKSFFIDEFLLTKKGLKIKSSTDKHLYRHSITAIYRRDNRDITRLIRHLQSKSLI